LRWIFFGIIAIHGLLHLIGTAGAFGFSQHLPLSRPIPIGLGFLWLAAALAMETAGFSFLLGHRSWWIVALGAVVLSQALIVSAWSDAKFGSIVNLLIMAGILYGFASQGPLSFHARYLREVRGRLAQPLSTAVITEADLEPLPEPVRRYVRLSGAVGQPRVHHFRAVWRGRIRSLATDPWMPFTAEQVNFTNEPARFFMMEARRGGLPVDVYHVFNTNGAFMKVRLLSLLPLVEADGPEVRQSETVTIFNDMCLLAPDSLISPAVRFESVDEHTTRAFYSLGDHTISASLSFNDRCELVEFTSDDRLATMEDGFVQMRFSTPVRGYREFNSRRVFTRGRAIWHPPEGEYTYLELELIDYHVNNPLP
jgi:hypothetical protein